MINDSELHAEIFRVVSSHGLKSFLFIAVEDLGADQFYTPFFSQKEVESFGGNLIAEIHAIIDFYLTNRPDMLGRIEIEKGLKDG